MADLRELVQVPGPKEKGFLRRALQVEELKRVPGPQGIYDVADFIIEYMTEKPKKARDLVLDASQEEIEAVLNALASGAPINPPNAAG